MKKHLKSILAAALALTLCAAMSACGNSKSIEDINEKDIEQALSELDKEYSDSKKESSSEKTQEIAPIDPFENLKVTFDGVAPYSSVKMSGGNSSVTYTASVEEGMKNGDVITITAEAKKSGVSLAATEKDYIAEGLAAYAMSVDEIPEETQEKMKNQAKDSLQAACASWREGNSLKDAEFMGYYFIHAKDGFSETPYNEIYCVYKMNASVTGLKRHGDGKTQETGEEIYYTYFRYSDIILLPDGTCSLDLSKGQMTNNTIDSDYGYYNLIATFYTYKGYKDLDSMFNECVAKKISSFEYENTVKE